MNKLKPSLKNTFKRFAEDEIFTRSAALSYYSSLALAPLLILFITILGYLNLNMQDQLIVEVKKLVGTQAALLLKSIITSTNDERELATLSGIIGISFLIFSASIIFNQLQNTLNIIFKTSEDEIEQITLRDKVKFFLTQRLLSFGMVFTFIFIVTISLVISTLISYLFQDGSMVFITPAQILINFLVFQILFMFIIKILPSKKISFKRSFIAGAIISFLFVLGKSAIGLYIGNTAIGSAYGAAGSLAIILVWFYYSALIIYFGAELAYSLVIE